MIWHSKVKLANLKYFNSNNLWSFVTFFFTNVLNLQSKTLAFCNFALINIIAIFFGFILNCSQCKMQKTKLICFSSTICFCNNQEPALHHFSKTETILKPRKIKLPRPTVGSTKISTTTEQCTSGT